MARNPIAANLLMAILLGGGLWSAVVIQKEVFPEYLLDVVEVRVGYPGAAPSEVEQGILRPIEGAVRGLEGIQRITSEAREGRGEVQIELVAGQPRMKAFQEIDQAISRIRTFPDQIEQPEVRLQSEQREVMQISIYGPIDIWALRKLAEHSRDNAVPPERVAKVVHHALSSRRPKTRYLVGPDARISRRLAQFLPDRWFDALLRRATGL